MTEDSEDKIWTAFVPIGQEPSKRWEMSAEEARRRAERARRRTEARFRRAPFPLYGLPSSWRGERFLGGGGWGSVGGRERIHALSLVHGVLVEGEGPMLVVETSRPGAPGGGGLLRSLAEQLWSGRAASVPDAIARLRAKMPDPHHAELSRRRFRTEAAVEVGGEPVVFDVLSQPEHWVGLAAIRDWDVTIEGHPFPLEGLELVEITDLEPYILGSRQFEDRGRT